MWKGKGTTTIERVLKTKNVGLKDDLPDFKSLHSSSSQDCVVLAEGQTQLKATD